MPDGNDGFRIAGGLSNDFTVAAGVPTPPAGSSALDTGLRHVGRCIVDGLDVLIQQDIKFTDGGWRNERDYARFGLAVDAYIRGCEAEVYSVNTTGEICRYCPFRSTCGGIGLPHENAGAP